MRGQSRRSQLSTKRHGNHPPWPRGAESELYRRPARKVRKNRAKRVKKRVGSQVHSPPWYETRLEQVNRMTDWLAPQKPDCISSERGKYQAEYEGFRAQVVQYRRWAQVLNSQISSKLGQEEGHYFKHRTIFLRLLDRSSSSVARLGELENDTHQYVYKKEQEKTFQDATGETRIGNVRTGRVCWRCGAWAPLE